MARNHVFAYFNGASPLLLAQRHDIPVLSLKCLPKFTGETSLLPIEYIQKVANLWNNHGITEDDVAVRLLASSLKGKALQWYRGLPCNSIQSWDELGERLCKYFEDRSDYVSLLEQLMTIKRVLHEYLTDFNYRFQKTWDRIPVVVKPTLGGAFLYYLKALDSDLALTLQSFEGDTLPAAYDIAIRAKNILI